MLTDGFLNPAFEKDVLDVLYKSLESSVHEISNEPQSCLSYNINEFLYKNHPYDVKVFVVPDSLENITKENMEALHERIISPENIIVAASGNIDSKKLIKKLNKTLGKLSKKTEQKLSESETSAAEISPVVISDFSDVMIENSSTKGTGFAMRVFSTPSQTDKDFLAFSIAMDMYSDVLFNVVREHYGACYSVSASFIGSKSSYGGEYVYQISDLKNFRKYADEALSYMKNGMLVDFFDEKGNAKLIPVKDRLLSYKNKYIASSYESAQSSHSEAFRLWYNILQFNDIERDEKLFSELYLLTSDDVVSAFNRYMNPDRGKWFVVYGEK